MGRNLLLGLVSKYLGRAGEKPVNTTQKKRRATSKFSNNWPLTCLFMIKPLAPVSCVSVSLLMVLVQQTWCWRLTGLSTTSGTALERSGSLGGSNVTVTWFYKRSVHTLKPVATLCYPPTMTSLPPDGPVWFRR